jgi:hypothetical protein
MTINNYDEWLMFILKATGVLWLFLNTKKIFALIRESFGRIDKPELLAMIFTPVLIWMLSAEMRRLHEWEIYDDFKFATVALIVMYGFGLKHILYAILAVKGADLKDYDKNLRNSSSDNPDSDS